MPNQKGVSMTIGGGVCEIMIWYNDANLRIGHAVSNQAAEVCVYYADTDVAWYEGPWEPDLPTRLADSPLRRQIAHDLATGTAAAFVLLESDNAATNEAIHALLAKELAIHEQETVLPEQLDYADEAAGYRGAFAGQGPRPVPLQARFSLHRLARTSPNERFFVRQITSLDPAFFESPEKPVVAVVFGQGRMIPLPGEMLSADLIERLLAFLCGPCSCRIKSINPGIDLLMAANWFGAVNNYPDSAETRLPDGTAFTFGGTGSVDRAQQSAAPNTIAPPEPQRPASPRHNLWPLAALVVLVLLAVVFFKR